jgi:rSAM/selenodomain-associated transferase 1
MLDAVRRALIVVAKKPSLGNTKTRLCPPLSEEQAVGLYRCLLLDTLQTMQQVQGVEAIIAYTPDDAENFFRALAPVGFRLAPQEGSSLGVRLHNVLSRFLAAGYAQAAVMNSDGPTLPAEYLALAFSLLDDPAVDLVLGPSDDGGYYLAGLKSPCAPLFREVTMSTPTVLANTLEQARRHNLRVALLPSWYDVDTFQDIRRLSEELRTAPPEVAPHTRAYLDAEGWL